jgi:hypothetical protein
MAMEAAEEAHAHAHAASDDSEAEPEVEQDEEDDPVAQAGAAAMQDDDDDDMHAPGSRSADPLVRSRMSQLGGLLRMLGRGAEASGLPIPPGLSESLGSVFNMSMGMGEASADGQQLVFHLRAGGAPQLSDSGPSAVASVMSSRRGKRTWCLSFASCNDHDLHLCI